jgi:hypothetical protein
MTKPAVPPEWWQDQSGEWWHPQPGWYPDPSAKTRWRWRWRWRWWDGYQWTDLTNYGPNRPVSSVSLPSIRSVSPRIRSTTTVIVERVLEIEPIFETAQPSSVFASDLRASASTLRTAPSLWFVTIALGLAMDIPTRSQVEAVAFTLVFFGIELFLAGFAGVQRVWFVQLFRGQSFDRAEVLLTGYP